jgi:hypothetical protein
VAAYAIQMSCFVGSGALFGSEMKMFGMLKDRKMLEK